MHTLHFGVDPVEELSELKRLSVFKTHLELDCEHEAGSNLKD
jgi:hypothetical protein